MIRTLLVTVTLAALVATLTACSGGDSGENVQVREVEEGAYAAPGTEGLDMAKEEGEAPEEE